jgi:hypothetical protein
MSATRCTPTQDGIWIAVCLQTNASASGSTKLDALEELERLLTTRWAA